jgi:hypothetical protein
MPPIRTQSSQNRTEQEGRILLAIQAIKNKKFPLYAKQRIALKCHFLLYGTSLMALQIDPKLAQIAIS